MSEQNSSGDDGSVDVGNREHPEQLDHAFVEEIERLLDRLMLEQPELRVYAEQYGGNVESIPEGGVEQPEVDGDHHEEIEQILDRLMLEEPELRAYAEQYGGNVESIPERGVEQQGANAGSHPEVNGDHQDSNVNSHPAEDHTATAVLELDPWQLRALEIRFRAVMDYYRLTSDMLEQGMKGRIFIAPNPNTPLETKVPHLETKRKRRPFGMKYNKDYSDKPGKACNTAICF
jgi:hypothetical protein